jgi:preprotein translocase subunit SecF
MNKFCILTITFIVSFSTISAQETKLINSSINDHFEEIISKSNSYQDFKVVKINALHSIKKLVSDSLKVQKSEIKSLHTAIDNQNIKTLELENTIKDLNNKIKQANSNIENINVIGSNLSKNTFKTLFWSILGLMTFFLLFISYKFKRSNTITQETKNLLIDVEKDFENHKKIALEREQKVMRKLQDELNKNRN